MILALALAGWVLAPAPQSVLGELQRLDRQLTSAEERLLTLTQRDELLRRELSRIETELASARLRQGEAWARYRLRLRALSRQPMGARVALLGGSRSLADFLEANRMLRWIARHDQALQSELQKQTEALEKAESSLRTKRKEHLETIAALERQRDALAKRRDERFTFLRQVSSARELRAMAAAEGTRAAASLASTVQKLEPAAALRSRFVQNRGRLPWPTAGSLDVAFGQKVEREFGTVISHNGWDLRAPAGTAVQAIAAGKVVFADWLEGYGQIVIVDHGEHYHSLVAHLGAMDVSRSQSVTAGQRLGTVGDTGSLRGTVLYFELRHRGVPVDPASWLRR